MLSVGSWQTRFYTVLLAVLLILANQQIHLTVPATCKRAADGLDKHAHCQRNF